MGCWKVNLRQAVGQYRRAKKRASSESANKRKTADREKGRAREKTVFRVKMSNVKTSSCGLGGFHTCSTCFLDFAPLKPND